ncbi:MAG: hypothetical protein ACRC28_10580 [Clostridium sp.]|uniref:hypothetical protein n=1 Tax=Clostridium sp. TaxID=1506 RepID=UPI003F2BE85C
MSELLISNITIEMDTPLVPPAIVSCDVNTINKPYIIGIHKINNQIVIQGVLKKTISYKIFDINSNIVEHCISNEQEFQTLFTLTPEQVQYIDEIPLSAISIDASNIDNYLSSITTYHRVFSHVAFNLNESVLLSITIDLDRLCDAILPLEDSFSPVLNTIINKGFSLPLPKSIQNVSLSNLNIRRFLIANVDKVFGGILFLDCCMLYSFFNNQNELICSEKMPFNLTINSTTINSTDEFAVIGSDIMAILDSSLNDSCHTLNETISLTVSAKKET